VEIIIEIEDMQDFNSQRTTSRQGIPAVNVGGETVNEFLEGYFFPGQPPSASISGGGDREKGDPNLAVLLSWSVTKGSEPITSVSVDGKPVTVTGQNQSGVFEGILSQDENKTFVIVVTDAAGKTASANSQVIWKFANYYGVSSLDPASMISQIQNPGQYAGSLIQNKRLASTKAENHDYNCTGGKYIYVLYPVSYGNPASVKNGSFDFSDYTVTNVTITDMFGIARQYKLFYTGYQTGSNVNINIIN
jgi:hypothetical protein